MGFKRSDLQLHLGYGETPYLCRAKKDA